MNSHKIWILILALVLFINAEAADTLKFYNNKISVNATLDVYFNASTTSIEANRPFSVSSNRNKEFNVNLAAVKFSLNDNNFRAVFHPAIGTYMIANYASEPSNMRNLLEANVGVKLLKKLNMWLDMGVLPSNFGNENSISKDQLMYTRSFGSEYVPYYLTGARLSSQYSKYFSTSFYVLNGWQRIYNNNQKLSFALNQKSTPIDKIEINFNYYVGNENSVLDSLFRMRNYTDMNGVLKPHDKIEVGVCLGIGNQEVLDTFKRYTFKKWKHANLTVKYSFNKKISVSARYEEFIDPEGVLLRNKFDNQGFKLFNTGLCVNYQFNENAMFRVEGRYVKSNSKYYQFAQRKWQMDDVLISTNLVAWF
jgi:hypothetical protein